MELSKDGINVNLGEESGTNEADVTAVQEEELIVEEEPAKEMDEEDGTVSCGEFIEDPEANDIAIEEILEYLPPKFPLPDCAKIGGTNTSYSTSRSVDFLGTTYRVEAGWKELYEEYKVFLESFDAKRVEKNQNAQSRSATLRLKTAEFSIWLNFNESAGGVTKVKIENYIFDEVEEEAS